MKTFDSVLVRRNFLRTSNPFCLEDPPTWFLDQLAALDSELVIFASVHQPCYRLCRRKKHTKGVYRPIASWPDTYITTAHNMDPWKSILPTSLDMSWGRVLQEIPEYDPTRFGLRTGDETADFFDRRDDERRAGLQRQQEDDLRQLGSFSYGVVKRATGQKVGLSDRQWAGYAPA